MGEVTVGINEVSNDASRWQFIKIIFTRGQNNNKNTIRGYAILSFSDKTQQSTMINHDIHTGGGGDDDDDDGDFISGCIW